MQLTQSRLADVPLWSLALAAATLPLGAASALAASGTWANNTGNADANWSTSTNWGSSNLPGGTDLAATNTDVATFASAASVETPIVDVSRRLSRISVDNTQADYNIGTSGGAYLVFQNAGQQLTYTGGGTSTISAHVRSTSSTILWNTGSTDLTLAGGFAITSATPTLQLTNTTPVTLSGTLTNAGTVAGTLTLVSTAGNSGDLNITGDIVHGAGAATFALSSDGGSNSYTGKVRISGNNNFTVSNFRTGTMEIASSTALNGGSMAIGTGTASSGALSIVITGPYSASRAISGLNGSGNGSVEIGGTNTSGTATWSGTVAISGRTGGINVTAASGGVVDFTNTVSGSASGIITKIGLGTVRLSSANTYPGGTNINAGAVLANNTSGAGTGTGAVAVNNTGTFGGTGSTGSVSTYAAVNVNAGGTLSPGDLTLASGSRAGTLAVGALTFSGANSAFAVDINGTTAGDGTGFYDQVLVTGAVTLSNDVNLTIDLGTFNPTDNGTQLFTLIANDAADAKVGTGLFNLNGSNQLTQGEEFLVGAQWFQISYTSGGTVGTFIGGGNDVALLAVPEPASLSLLALGACSVLRRRRIA